MCTSRAKPRALLTPLVPLCLPAHVLAPGALGTHRRLGWPPFQKERCLAIRGLPTSRSVSTPHLRRGGHRDAGGSMAEEPMMRQHPCLPTSEGAPPAHAETLTQGSVHPAPTLPLWSLANSDFSCHQYECLPPKSGIADRPVSYCVICYRCISSTRPWSPASTAPSSQTTSLWPRRGWPT